MEYSKIISITGLPGLFELVSTKSDGGIVRSLDDKTTKFVSSRVHQFSHLESIEVYTVKNNVNLVTILQAMDSSKEKLPDEKNNDELRKYFESVYPDIDFERVYSSDLKKMVKWYAGLKKSEIELKLSEVAEPEVEEAEEEVVVKKEAPAKKAAKAAEPKPEAKASPAKPATAKPAPAAKKAVKAEEPVKAKPAAKKEEKPKAAKPVAKKAAKEEKPSAAVKSKKK